MKKFNTDVNTNVNREKQFSGMYAVNGAICEGDVLVEVDMCNPNSISDTDSMVCKWLSFGFFIVNRFYKGDRPDEETLYNTLTDTAIKYRIVGNIYNGRK